MVRERRCGRSLPCPTHVNRHGGSGPSHRAARAGCAEEHERRCSVLTRARESGGRAATAWPRARRGPSARSVRSRRSCGEWGERGRASPSTVPPAMGASARGRRERARRQARAAPRGPASHAVRDSASHKMPTELHGAIRTSYFRSWFLSAMAVWIAVNTSPIMLRITISDGLLFPPEIFMFR